MDNQNEIIVSVRFKEAFKNEYESKGYNFIASIELQEGDFVIVETQYGFQLGKVSSTSSIRLSRGMKKSDLKEIVCKCDMSEYNERVIRKERALELKKLMDKKVKELQEIALYESLCANDESFKSLLDEYKELVK